jgi:hypothetical protein
MTTLLGLLLVIGGIIQLGFAVKAFQVYRKQAVNMTSPQIAAYGYLYAFFIGGVFLLIGIGLLLGGI